MKSALRAVVLSLACGTVLAQESDAQQDWGLSSNLKRAYQEKVFVHIDRANYLAGETVWFKVYLTDASSHAFSQVSKVVYMEVLDRENIPVIQTKIKTEGGRGSGSVSIPVSINSGNYRLRCYSQWMKNFDPEYFFSEEISIINTFRKVPKIETEEKTKLHEIAFFPEGGHLVAGLEAVVGVRGIDQDGKGIDFQGAIVSRHDTVVRFHAEKFGMSSFCFVPQPGESYAAVYKPKAGKWTPAEFPKTENQGVSFHVRDSGNYVLVKLAMAGALHPHLVVAHTRGNVRFCSTVSLDRSTDEIKVPIDSLREGINTITLFDANFRPLCERLFFKRAPSQGMALQLDASTLTPRKKVQLELQLAATLSESERASVSIAVVQPDPFTDARLQNIDEYLLLNSDLKGNVESPGYYFSEVSSETNRGLDLVMLCHGWSKYRWTSDAAPDSKIEFLPEYGTHMLTGVVTSKSGMPVPNVWTYLASPGKDVHLYPAMSDGKGMIRFEGFSLEGQRKVILQMDPDADTSHTIRIQSPFSMAFSTRRLSIFNLSPLHANALLERSIAMQANSHYWRTKEKTAAGRDSSTFYGQPDELYRLDDYTRFPVLEEVLREYVSGVRVRKKDGVFSFSIPNKINNHILDGNPLVLLDGVPIFDVNKLIGMDPLKMKEIDVVARKYYLNGKVFSGIASFRSYQGDLAGFVFDHKAVVIDYEGLQRAKEFYTPRYDTQAQIESRKPDQRSLLFWRPDVNLTKSKKAVLDFYTSDLKGVYTITIQGLTDSGRALHGHLDFKVE